MQRAVIESQIPALLPGHLGHPVSAVRHAAVWTAINLFLVPAGANEAMQHAVRYLLQCMRLACKQQERNETIACGAQVTLPEVVQLREVLVKLKQDDVLDIRERSRYALKLLDRFQIATVVNT